MTKQASKEERRHMTRVAELGCIVCRNEGHGWSAAEVHHIRHQIGAGRRSSHFQTIGLCSAHHRLGNHGVALHAGKRTWEARYGTELELLEQTRELLQSTVG